MKTIEELANLGAAAAALKNPETFLIGISPESQFWKGDQPAREAFARAVRDAVLADQPAADVPTWRPIAELLHTSKDQYIYWDGQEMWEGSIEIMHNATHYLVPPPKPDPFEVWWATQNFVAFGSYKAECRAAWNAAQEAKP